MKTASLEGGYKVAKNQRLFLGTSLASLRSFRESNRLVKKEAVNYEESKHYLGWATEGFKPANFQLSLAYVYNRDL